MPKVKKLPSSTPLKANSTLNWQEALRLFILELKANGKAKRTIDDYEYHVNLFFKRHPRAAQVSNLQEEVLRYFGQTVRPATFNLRRKYLKGFFEWYVQKPESKGSFLVISVSGHTLQIICALGGYLLKTMLPNSFASRSTYT